MMSNWRPMGWDWTREQRSAGVQHPLLHAYRGRGTAFVMQRFPAAPNKPCCEICGGVCVPGETLIAWCDRGSGIAHLHCADRNSGRPGEMITSCGMRIRRGDVLAVTPGSIPDVTCPACLTRWSIGL